METLQRSCCAVQGDCAATGTYDDTVRNINIGRVGYLRHSSLPAFPPSACPRCR